MGFVCVGPTKNSFASSFTARAYPINLDRILNFRIIRKHEYSSASSNSSIFELSKFCRHPTKLLTDAKEKESSRLLLYFLQNTNKTIKLHFILSIFIKKVSTLIIKNRIFDALTYLISWGTVTIFLC